MSLAAKVITSKWRGGWEELEASVDETPYDFMHRLRPATKLLNTD